MDMLSDLRKDQRYGVVWEMDVTRLDYEIEPEKKFPWGWLIGGIVFLLFGACSFALVGVFKNIGVVKPINDRFIETALDRGLPPFDEGLYSEKSGITDELLEPVNTMIFTLGPPNEIGETNCSANSNTGTGELSGQFVDCSGSVTYSTTAASFSTNWRKEGEDWKLLGFNLDVADAEAYGQLVVERERANQAPAQD